MDNKVVNNNHFSGVKPASMVAWSRINELATAIKEIKKNNIEEIQLCQEWAKEILLQCQIIKAFRRKNLE